MAYTSRPFNYTGTLPNQVQNDLGLANDNFDILGQAFVSNDPATGTVKNADTVDGFHASQTPAPNVIVPLDANGILNLSATYVKSNVYSFRRVDLTNATSDYMLQVGEEAYISFSNVTSVPLHIATQSKTAYSLCLIVTNNAGTSGATAAPIFLNPNNTTYANAFAYRDGYAGDSGAFAGSAIAYNGFKIGWAFSFLFSLISNSTTAKMILSKALDWGAGNLAVVITSVTVWNDTVTTWTSLGTITFPQSTSGYVLVRRLA
jgi:hypothetical protein